MNVTGCSSFANENGSEETNVCNSTGTTSMSQTGWTTTSDVHWTTYVIVVVQWIIFFIGSVGNITVLVVLLWSRRRSQVGTQLFVGSLAVSDIGLMFSSVWTEAYDALQTNWLFGVVPCKFKFFWQWLTMNCSAWTLAILSIDRYWNVLTKLLTVDDWFYLSVTTLRLGTGTCYRKSVCLLSVVCNVRAPYWADWDSWQCTLALHNFTKIVPMEPIHRRLNARGV